MAFDLKKFFVDIFAPKAGDVLTILYDIPHGDIKDRSEWKKRREMAEKWRDHLSDAASEWDITVKPILSYEATGSNNADLPEIGSMGGKEVNLEKAIQDSTIIIAMPEFSASAPLIGYTKKFNTLRVGSMPQVSKEMEESGLSADYKEIAKKCKRLEPFFKKAIGVEVEFSTGHKCYFDISRDNTIYLDDGLLPPEVAGTNMALHNLPAGEVFIVPNEDPDSKTHGEIPEMIDGEVAVMTVEHNKITDIKGKGPKVLERRKKYQEDPAWQNIAECAIGLNDKAKVRGIILEDEKAGFHWAYGLSAHIGGTVGVKDFTSPGNVIHEDVIYAKGNPIVCKKFDFVFPDGTRKTAIVDGELII